MSDSFYTIEQRLSDTLHALSEILVSVENVDSLLVGERSVYLIRAAVSECLCNLSTSKLVFK